MLVENFLICLFSFLSPIKEYQATIFWSLNIFFTDFHEMSRVLSNILVAERRYKMYMYLQTENTLMPYHLQMSKVSSKLVVYTSAYKKPDHARAYTVYSG